ncbi:MAG: NAD(P)H-hydrate dehydratase [Oscillospiraceae bacterium]|nr:NAD(P)H-hydrate dehydratase [Oscillospiraceae bacterium]
MKLVTAEQIREIDRQAIQEHGIPGTTLMSNAAEFLAKAAMEHIPPDGCAAVFCGIGNNGGDGIGAAAYLIAKGISTRAFLVSNPYDELKPDAEVMKERLISLGGSLEHFSPSADLVDYIGECNVIIDAIFGIGLKSELSDEALSAVSIIHSSDALVIAADIPTGIEADTGAILGDAVQADITITFTLAKPGHFVEPGCIYTGELRVCDIGIPKSIINKTVSHMYSASQSDIHLPRRKKDTHKGDYGRALILAGSIGYTGAPALSARAATKMGTGLVSLGVPKSIYDIMAVKLDEEMPFPLPDDKNGKLIANGAGEILKRTNASEVCLIGPGLGTSDDISELVQSIVRNTNTPIVLDADGLNAIAKDPGILNQATCPIVLTPHPGEFVRLGGNFTGDRLKSACDFAHKYDCILVLKGHRTIIALPNGIAYVNTTGGPAMAKGGTGDVLAGMITALIAQKLPIVHAVAAAVYLHGLAGDMCAAEYGEYCVTATDIIEMLPNAIKICQGDGSLISGGRFS